LKLSTVYTRTMLSCKKVVNDDDKGLSCQKCSSWYHSQCLNITAAEYKVMHKYENLMWFCTGCKSAVDDLISKMSVRMDKTDKCIENVSDKMDQVLEKLDDKCSRNVVKEIVDEVVEGKIDSKIEEYMREKEDREKRKCNLMLFNVPESSDESIDQRIIFDRGQAELILDRISEVEEAALIENPKRMGKQGNKARPLRVTLETPAIVTKYVKKGKDLKETGEFNSDTEFIKSVFISPDFTAQQRVERKKLVEELRERRGNGEKNLRIFQGKVLSKPPGGSGPGRGGRV